MSAGVPNFSGQRLAALRKRRGMSQMDLAIEIDMTLMSVAFWEHRHRHTPTAPSLRKLACALHCRESALLARRNAAA